MSSRPFENSQHQSEIGVALIFFSTLYKLIRGFWAVIAYLIFSSPGIKTWVYIGVGFVAVAVLILGYSIAYYRKFTFHIDYEKEAFVLQKGVFITESTEIPFEKIQQVNTEQSLLQRLGNVHKLVIETAGGKEKEASIHAVSKVKADQVSTILMEAKETAKTVSPAQENVSGARDEVLWSYKIDLITLLKIGISSNYFRGLVIMLAFFSTIYQELSNWFRDSLVLDEYANQFSGLSKSISGILLLTAVFLVASILITMIEVFIKYFNLKLKQTKGRLQVEMGLKTNKKISLQPRRVQLLQVKTNPVQQKMNLHELKISLANSEDTLQKSKIRIPGLGRTTLGKVQGFLYQEKPEHFKMRVRPGTILLYRRLFFSLLPVVVAWSVWWAFPFMKEFLLLLITGTCTLLVAFYQIKYYQSLSLLISDDFLQKKSGVWNKREEILEIYKIQSITVAQPYFYKNRNLVDLIFHTAGGDLFFRTVNEKKVRPYLNYAFYKIESARQAWM